MELGNFVSLGGVFCLMVVAWLISANRWKINWRVIFWGVGLQFLFGFIIFWLPAGVALFH